MVGQWCLHYLNHLAKKNRVKYQVQLYSRDSATVLSRMVFEPENLEVSSFRIDQLTETFSTFKPSHIWHFAADTGSSLGRTRESQAVADSDLTQHLVDLINRNRLNCTLLYSSSGAVYGRRRTKRVPIAESESVISISLENADPYDLTKTRSEQILEEFADIETSVVGVCRLFAFIGPLVPTNQHFAIGNFIGAASRGQPVVLKSSGRDFRSWLYCSDLARYLIALTFTTQSFVVNVGSPEWLTIGEAAELVANIGGVGLTKSFDIGHDETGKPSFYVPDVSLLNSMVSIGSLTGLADAIERTIHWHRQNFC